MKIINAEKFRSDPTLKAVNTNYNMVRVTIDMSNIEYKKFLSRLNKENR